MSNLKCYGCGATLQSTDENGVGYVPQDAMKNEQILCKRCFRIKNYNEAVVVDMKSDDFFKVVSSIGYENALVVLVIDLFDFSGSFINGINRLVLNNPIMLVCNKRDLLPKAVNDNKIVNWVKKQAKDNGLKVVDIALISASKGFGIDNAMDLIDEHRENKSVYVVGCTNVGKSTFINQILKRFGGETKDWITTSYYPGTTLDKIEVPLDEDTFLVDTPGIINEHQFAHYVDNETLKIITPKKEVNQRIYQLSEKQTLFIGGLCRFDFQKGADQSIVCFFSNLLDIHRTKLENADSVYENNITKLLKPPTEKDMLKLPPLKKHSFKLSGKKDIVVSGLGWFRINSKNIELTIHAPEGVGVFVRDAIV